MVKSKNAIVLCSGGLDSVVCAHYVKKQLKYMNVKIVFFNYGQKAIIQERKFSKRCAFDIGAEFIEMSVDNLEELSNSLINKEGKIKKLNRKNLKNTKKESEKFYVPCRNTLFLIYALALAESLYIKSNKKEIYDLFVGFKNEGRESYSDTTKQFVEKVNQLAKIACIKNFKIIAPFIKSDKEEIVQLGKKLGVNFKKTFSCYAPKNSKQCGFCLACKLRQEGFYWAGVEDPSDYFKT